MARRKPLTVADGVAKTPPSKPLPVGPTEDADRLRAAMAATAVPKRPRGRPLAKDSSVADMFRGLSGIAAEVLERARQLGGRRGALAEAKREVAAAHGVSFENVEAAVKRHPWLRDVDDALSQVERRDQDEAELQRRMSGMPADVRRMLGPLDATSILELLRSERIDGTCPSWLIEAARR